MRWTYVCPLFGVAVFACATGQDQFPSPGLNAGNENAGGSASGTGGSSTDGGSSGTFATGGSNASGSSTGGTFNVSGTTSFAGTFSTGGTSAGGTAMGGAGGASGTGGKASGGAGSGGVGGKAGGGAGSGGTGGGGSAQCVGITIPAKSTWKGSALRSSAADPPAKAFDGDNTTRYATGAPQAGDEWLEIDFGKVVTINEITMHTNNNDYFRHYQLRLSNKSQDFNAAILNEADGMTGTITVPLAQAHTGQYLTIRQTGMVTPTWWSLHEVTVDCK
jgi:hypothetical protein